MSLRALAASRLLAKFRVSMQFRTLTSYDTLSEAVRYVQLAAKADYHNDHTGLPPNFEPNPDLLTPYLSKYRIEEVEDF